MATTIKQQVALDEALVHSAQRLRIRHNNFRLPLNIQLKESTLQVVYDVLRRPSFFRAFLVTADDLKSTCRNCEPQLRPRVLGQSFAELPFEGEILEFFRFLGHSAQIKTLTDFNVNKLYQPWRSFAVVINKLSATAKGKQPTRTTSPTDPSDVERTEAEQLKIVLRRSRHETHISQQDYGHIKWIEDLVPHPMWIQELINYDKHALWGVSHWGQKRQQFYGLRLQDIEDMLLLLVQGKLSNLTVEERFAFNVSLRMFTRSIIIQRRVEDLQLGVESYQKRLNLTKPNMYRSDLKRRKAYTAYSNPRGFIYQNKDKKNRFMRIDELHKFSDGTLNDVHNALDDRLKGIRMQYLPTTI
nr:hypothetical protein [Tanacetum cinerariifolium]